MADIIHYTEVTTSILLFVLFIIGLFYSKIYQFKPGIYFFLILIFHNIYQYILPRYIDYQLMEYNTGPFGLTIGTFVVLATTIGNIILIAGFVILILGLVRYFNTNKHTSKSISSE